MTAKGVNGVNGARSKPDLAALKVDQSRLMDAIHFGCTYGAAHRYGEYERGIAQGNNALIS